MYMMYTHEISYNCLNSLQPLLGSVVFSCFGGLITERGRNYTSKGGILNNRHTHKAARTLR